MTRGQRLIYLYRIRIFIIGLLLALAFLLPGCGSPGDPLEDIYTTGLHADKVATEELSADNIEVGGLSLIEELDKRPRIIIKEITPSTPPEKVGDIYINTAEDTVFIAVGIEAVSDWKQMVLVKEEP